MAGDWIKFELTTLDKPEVCQIADLADIDLDAVIGKLMRIWGWFDQQTEEGNAPSVTKKLLDRLVGVSGFCEHMKLVGWMVECDGLISLPHFERHNGKTAKNRALTARRVAKHKSGNDEGNASSVKPPLPREEREKSNTHTPREPGAVFEMTLDWVAPEGPLKAYATRAGIPVEAFTREATAKFVMVKSAKGVCMTETQWVAELVAWVQRDRANATRVVPIRAGQSSPPDFDSTAWSDDLGAL